MAETYYNHLTDSDNADSAGTAVEIDGETLTQRRKRIGGTVAIDLAKREGWDISQSSQTQLTSEMLDAYDVIISMAIPSVTPSWLSAHKNYRWWDIPDPGATSLEKLDEAFTVIKRKISNLIERP